MRRSNTVIKFRSLLAEHLRMVLSVAVVATFGCLGACCNTSTALSTVASTVTPSRFLGPDDFQGGFIPASGPVKFGLQSTYSGTVVVTMIDRAEVEKVMLPGVHLATLIAASTTHPVIFLIGEQREPKTLDIFGNPSPTLGPGYREMILLVPFVVFDSGTNWHNYAVRMYLDDQTAVDGGNFLFGYAKEFADLNKTQPADHTKFEVVRPFGGPTWFNSDVQMTGPLASLPQAAVSLPRWTDLQKIFTMPVLGWKPDILNPSGFICSYWEWDFANAKLAPATSQHQVVTKFRAGMEEWPNMNQLYNALDGAVYMDSVRWRLALPLLASPLPPCQP